MISYKDITEDLSLLDSYAVSTGTHLGKGKGKVHPIQATKAQRGIRCMAVLFLQLRR
jgi:hypothetical protein